MKLRTDLPIKYHVKSHRLCSSYPTETDVLYDIVEHIFSTNKRKKTWKVEDMRVLSESIKDIFPDIAEDNFKDSIKTILSTLHKNNHIAIADGYIIVTEEGLSKLYVI